MKGLKSGDVEGSFGSVNEDEYWWDILALSTYFI